MIDLPYHKRQISSLSECLDLYKWLQLSSNNRTKHIGGSPRNTVSYATLSNLYVQNPLYPEAQIMRKVIIR